MSESSERYPFQFGLQQAGIHKRVLNPKSESSLSSLSSFFFAAFLAGFFAGFLVSSVVFLVTLRLFDAGTEDFVFASSSTMLGSLVVLHLHLQAFSERDVGVLVGVIGNCHRRLLRG